MTTRFPSSSPLIFSDFSSSGPVKPSSVQASAAAPRRALGDITNNSKSNGNNKNQTQGTKSSGPLGLKVRSQDSAPLKISAPKSSVSSVPVLIPNDEEIQIEKSYGVQGAFIEPLFTPSQSKVLSSFEENFSSILRTSFVPQEPVLQAEVADEASFKELSDEQLADFDFNMDDF
jgi:hypothetical protein